MMKSKKSMIFVLLIWMFMISPPSRLHASSTYPQEETTQNESLRDYENREVSMELWKGKTTGYDLNFTLPSPYVVLQLNEYNGSYTFEYQDSIVADSERTVHGYYGIALYGCYRFNADWDYSSVYSSNFTFLLVFKMYQRVLTTAEVLFSIGKWGDASGECSLTLYVDDVTNEFKVLWEYGTGTNTEKFSTGIFLELDRWYMLFFRHDSTHGKVYLDVYAPEDNSHQSGIITYAGSYPWWNPNQPCHQFGNHIDADGSNNLDTIKCDWDLYYVWNAMLSDIEVRNITNTLLYYNNNTAYFRNQYSVSKGYFAYTTNTQGFATQSYDCLYTSELTIFIIRKSYMLSELKFYAGVGNILNERGLRYGLKFHELNLTDDFMYKLTTCTGNNDVINFLNFTYTPYIVIQQLLDPFTGNVIVRIYDQLGLVGEIEQNAPSVAMLYEVYMYIGEIEKLVILKGEWDPSAFIIRTGNAYLDPLNQTVEATSDNKVMTKNVYLINENDEYATITLESRTGYEINVLVAPHSSRILSIAVSTIQIGGTIVHITRDYTVYLAPIPTSTVKISLYNEFTGLGVPVEMFKVYVNGTRISSPLEYNAPIGSSVKIEVYDFWNRLLFNSTYHVNNSAEYIDIPLELGSLYIYNEMDTDLKVNVSCLNATSEIILSFVIFRHTGVQLQMPAGVYNITFISGNETVRIRSMLVQVTLKGEQLEVNPSKIVVSKRTFSNEREIFGIPESEIRKWLAMSMIGSIVGIMIREIYIESKKKQMKDEKKQEEMYYMWW